jgi:hypothetical protein
VSSTAQKHRPFRPSFSLPAERARDGRNRSHITGAIRLGGLRPTTTPLQKHYSESYRRRGQRGGRPAWPTARGLGPRPLGVRGFESHPPHHLNLPETGFLTGFNLTLTPFEGVRNWVRGFRNCMTPIGGGVLSLIERLGSLTKSERTRPVKGGCLFQKMEFDGSK